MKSEKKIKTFSDVEILAMLPTGEDIEKKFRTVDPKHIGFAYGSPNDHHCQEGVKWCIDFVKSKLKKSKKINL